MKYVPAFAVALVLLPLYVLRLDAVAGMMGDDAWYVLLAKALAAGQGYQLTNAPVAGILPGYPPGFPALLSLVFLMRPDFPANVWLLKSISIVAMLGAALVTYVHLHCDRQLPRHLAACVAIAVGTTPALVFLATSTVMSDCVFTLAQLATVVVAHRATTASRGEAAWRGLIAAAVLGAATVFVRSAGVAIVAAVFVLLLSRRQWTRAAVFGGVVAVCLLPWLIYTRTHEPTPAQRDMHRGSIVYSYKDQFWMRWAGSPSTGRITPAELPDRVARNAIDVFGRAIGAVFVPALLRGSEESGEEVLSVGGNVGWTFVGMGTAANMAISLVLSAIVLWGFVRTVRRQIGVTELAVVLSLALTFVWPFYTFRFILPLAPFLYFYFVQGLRFSRDLSVARVVLLVVIGLNVYDHAGYILRARSNPESIDWLVRFREVDATLAWMRDHLDRDAVVATTNPALAHLRTGNKTITLDTLTEPWDVWRSRGAEYVASLIPRELPSRSRGSYVLLYQGPKAASFGTWIIGID